MDKMLNHDPEWRPGWRTLVGATGATATGAGMLAYTASYFVKPLEAAMGWARADIAFGATLGHVTIALTMPVVGLLADRFGAKLVGLLGLIGYGLLCLVMATMPIQLATYYVALVAISILAAGTSAVVFSPLVASRFKRRRGTALGIMMSGSALLLIPLAPVLVNIINTMGWQAGYIMLGAMALFIGVPSAIFAIRQTPGPLVSVRGGQEKAPGLGLLEAIKTATYWKMIGGVVFSTLPLGGFLHQLSALLSDKGLSVAEVGGMASLYVIAIMTGRLTVGLLLDLLSPPLVVFCIMVSAATGTLLLLPDAPPLMICMLATCMVGSAMGAEGDIQAFFTARQFGLRAFSTIFGTFAMCTATGFGFGALVFGQLHDLQGGYQLALALAAGSFLIAGLCFGSVSGKGRRHEEIDAQAEPAPAT